MLVSFLPPVRKPIPHEPGQWMEFRKPGNGLVTEARKRKDAEGRRGLSDFGVEIFNAIRKSGSEDEQNEVVKRMQRIEKLQEYHPDQFDRNILLGGASNPNDPNQPFLGAIAGWSYLDANGQPVPATADQIQTNLDEPTAAWAHGVVVDMLKPSTSEESKSDAPGGASGA